MWGLLVLILITVFVVKLFSYLNEKNKQKLENERYEFLVNQATEKLKNGLPVEQTSINLKKGEVCHFVGNCSWREYRKVRGRLNYSGPTLRLKIFKGVYWRAGSLNLKNSSNDVLQEIDHGTLYITNKRIIFDGSQMNLSINYDRIFKIDYYLDVFVAKKYRGKDVYFYTGDPLPGMIASTVIQGD